jgi:cell division protein FtsZ
MTEMGKAMMGTGEASGEDRALMAAQNAIANPLLDEITLKGAKAVLVNVTGGLDMTLLEVDEAANAISAEVDPDANIIFGAAFDPSLDGKIRVSVVATGMDGSSMQAIEPKPTRAPVSTPAPRRLEETLAPRAAAAASEPAQPIAAAAAALEPAPLAGSQWSLEAAPREPAKAAAPVQLPAEPEFYFEQPAAAQASEPRREAAIAAPRYTRADSSAVEEPLFPEAPMDDHRRPKNGLLSLFGGRRRHDAPTYAEPQAQRSAPVPQARTAASVQPVEDERIDGAEDLEIPSFLRRLAN